ncbi:helix-turn-helix domain-containing protein [Streptomyces lydicus]|uniref:helix-turn-helix domain-containing protein n=1 Tax=Streptomyces lydicus TaxID=47763 RepID=UPI000525E519|nr:helix-turn-helix transcriptional regulator [Streptomyces lydicus]MDC7337397.1 helix-turn-helix transcriptional regulator [Streptomyces lydicus]UEG93212.1 helix-turn-helix transcriptional regulator [Streptomyces lydicus]
MELNNEDDGRATPRTVLGRRLRRLREAADLSQRALADKVGYPHTYLSRVKRGEQLPSQALAEDLDTHFATDGLFTELLSMAQDASIPDYGRAIVEREGTAARIQVFGSSLVPGLLQTEDYARALFRASLCGESEQGVEERVATRMRRQQVLTREDAPLYWAILDEAALKRPIGGPEGMCRQIRHTLAVARSPHVVVQVLPFSQAEHPMLGGSLSLLTLRNGATIGYVESFFSGEQVEAPGKILELTHMFDLARAKALPESETLDLLRSYLREYEDEDDS